MATELDVHSDLPVPPGDYLAEVLEELGMAQSELALRMGRPAQMVNELVKGKKRLTEETALHLSSVLPVPAHIWVGLEMDYRLALARGLEQEQLKCELALLKGFPFRELEATGLFPHADSLESKASALRYFLGVTSLNNLSNVKTYEAAFRCKRERTETNIAVAAWLEAGRRLAASRYTGAFGMENALSALSGLRKLSTLTKEDALIAVSKALSECGVVFVLMPHWKGTYVSGATFWLPGGKPVLLLSLRGKWADIFWFSLFHEVGHVVLHDSKSSFVERDKQADVSKTDREKEVEADVFAEKALIHKKEYMEFVNLRRFDEDSIRRFAKAQGVSTGIVVGRLQHSGLIPHSRFNHLREKW
jgi:HTH-type transcriptional regulator/antitoxin HigA